MDLDALHPVRNRTRTLDRRPLGRAHWLAVVPLLLLPASLCRAQAPDSAAKVSLGVSPLVIDAAADVWNVIARPDNPIWPGWDASDTPLLLYLPGEQELLINHPHPPDGFQPYDGPASFPRGTILMRNGTTLVQADGQNTAVDIGGVRTLVVADPLSALRQRVLGLLEDPRPASEKARGLDFDTLVQDPYDQLALVVHEAFHVFQHRVAPNRGANEMMLLYYPVLSVDNNVGSGLEASALAAAIEAPDGAFRDAVLRWLAIRLERRRQLPAQAIQYEDRTEFMEGLAKYTEYRLFQVLEGRTPGRGLVGAQGFHGYRDLSRQRHDLITAMTRNLRGEANVNNDPYGTAPLRFRLYYSGMGIGLILDRLAPNWKRDVIAADTSLTDLVRDSLHPTHEQLAAALAAADSDSAAATLRVAKEKLAREGRRRVAAKLAALERGQGTRLIIDYSALSSTRIGLRFTPFGITVVDSVRTFFEQVPIQVSFPDGSELAESAALPLLRDTHRREVSCRLEKSISRAELAHLLGGQPPQNGASHPIKLTLGDVRLDLKNARMRWEPGTIRISLVPASSQG